MEVKSLVLMKNFSQADPPKNQRYHQKRRVPARTDQTSNRLVMLPDIESYKRNFKNTHLTNSVNLWEKKDPAKMKLIYFENHWKVASLFTIKIHVHKSYIT